MYLLVIDYVSLYHDKYKIVKHFDPLLSTVQGVILTVGRFYSPILFFIIVCGMETIRIIINYKGICKVICRGFLGLILRWNRPEYLVRREKGIISLVGMFRLNYISVIDLMAGIGHSVGGFLEGCW